MRSNTMPVLLVAGALLALGLVPFLGSGYHLAVAIGILSQLVLATAWALFSGTTRYVSLATVAFFGIGAYTVAVLGEVLPWPVVLLTATAIGIAVAMLVGLSTQRLSGVYFVIFSFGLAELIRRFGGLVAVNGLSMMVAPSEIVGLSSKVDYSASQLTYIDQKRLELARALALAPELLLLDEWLAGLNPSELQDGIALIRSLRDEGLAIILVEHVMDAIRSLCDRCVVMSAGTMIAAGPPASVLTDAEVIRAYLGDPDA